MFREVIIHANGQWLETGTNKRRHADLGDIYFVADTDAPLKPQIDNEMAVLAEIRNRHNPTAQITDIAIESVALTEDDGRYTILDSSNLEWPKEETEENAPRIIMQP